MSGEELKNKLKRTGKTITEIAHLLGISQAGLSQALCAKDVKTGLVEELARVLNLPVGYFYGEADNVTTVASGQQSIAAVNSHIGTADAAILEERVRMLQAVVSEKERLIQVLLKGK